MVIETYKQTQSIKATAKKWSTSRNVVRKWVRRYEKYGKSRLRVLGWSNNLNQTIGLAFLILVMPPLILDKISTLVLNF